MMLVFDSLAPLVIIGVCLASHLRGQIAWLPLASSLLSGGPSDVAQRPA
jgi:hypothetical protein